MNENKIFEKKYVEPIILENVNLEKYFKKDYINKAISNNKKLQITDKGLYSISKYHDSIWILNMIKIFLKNNNVTIDLINIIDSTAGLGGNTLIFSEFFKKVFAIEINETHFKVLNNNINAVSINNVELYNDNFLNIINSDKDFGHNIFFLDPPWGGKSYKNYQYFNLKIGKYPIFLIINMLFDKKFKYVALKAPHNLNLSPIYSNIKYENMSIHSNQKKNMILVFFY